MKHWIRVLIWGLCLTIIGCGGSQGNKGSWKAVFLTSGQVYYGKLTRNQGQFYKLQDVYYIRVNQPQGDDKTKTPDLTLVKLGNEIHGPEDAIYLNRDHILYIEDLKEEGQVAKAIAEAKTAGTNPAMAGQPPSPTMPTNTAGASPDQAEQFKQFQKFLENQKQAQNPPAEAEKKK